MKHEADEEKAEVARLSSFVGAMAIGDLVKSTLGPKGMDKILWGMGRNDGVVEVTFFLLNGFTIKCNLIKRMPYCHIVVYVMHGAENWVYGLKWRPWWQA